MSPRTHTYSNRSASSRDFPDLVDLVEETGREYIGEDGHYSVHAGRIRENIPDETPQRIGKAFAALERRGIFKRGGGPENAGTSSGRYWWTLTDSARDPGIEPPYHTNDDAPAERPSTRSAPEDFLIRSDDLPDWVPPHLRQIRRRHADDVIGERTVYPCPDEECDTVFDHPDGTFRHCARAHGTHYLEVHYGDSFDRLVIELHRQHEIPPTQMRDVIPMDADPIRARLKELDAFVPFVNEPGKDVDTDRLGGLAVSGEKWREIEEKCDWDAIELD